MPATIEYIEDLIATLEKAAEANVQTPGREGTVVTLDDELAGDVMITADLHGHRSNFALIRRVANLDENPRRHLILQEVCHGGPAYPSNSGCMSHTMLEDVARLKAKYPDRVHFLMSNHELAELTDYPILKNRKMLNLLFRLGMQEMYGPATEKVRQSYLKFLRTLPSVIRLPGDVVVCHSAPNRVDSSGFDKSFMNRDYEPEDFAEHSPLFEMVWGRDYRPENAKAFAELIGAKVLIHGHDPCPEEGFRVPNDIQIILDCCARPATYLILPTDRALSHAEIVERITKL